MHCIVPVRWSELSPGMLVYEQGRDRLYGPFTVKDVKRRILHNPKLWVRLGGTDFTMYEDTHFVVLQPHLEE